MQRNVPDQVTNQLWLGEPEQVWCGQQATSDILVLQLCVAEPGASQFKVPAAALAAPDQVGKQRWRGMSRAHAGQYRS